MRFRLLALMAALALAMTACSGGDAEDTGSDEAAAPAAAGTVTFVGTETLKWEETSKEATAEDGSLEVTIECDGAVPHNVVLEGVNGDEVIAECSGDDSASDTVEVEAGTYTYYCAIPGHREAGMEGELTLS